jgi:hypothetical protein
MSAGASNDDGRVPADEAAPSAESASPDEHQLPAEGPPETPETPAPVLETPAPETPVLETPETSVPETPTPETPETPAPETLAPEASEEPSRRRRYGPAAVSILLYCVLAAFVYGAHPPATSATLPPCACGDISSQVWFLAWPAYALSHGLNPFYTNWANYPHGVNLMNNTADPLLGILFAPFTLAFGALSTFSLLMRLAFALSGISMYFALRRWTTWWPAAFVGGLLYEFSPFMVGQSQSHLFLTFVPLPPLMMALLDAIVVRRRHVVRNGVVLGIVAAAQLLISPEILVIGLLGALGAFVVMALRHPFAVRERIRDLIGGSVATGVTLLVVAAYPLWVYFRGPYHVSGAPHPVSELDQYHSYPGSLIYPTSLQRFGFGGWLTKGMALLQGNGVEHTTYVGVTMLALLVFIVIRCRRVGLVQVFSLLAFGGWVVTLGLGKGNIKLPFALIVKIPVINGALDLRYSFLMYLGISVVLAVGLDHMRREGIFAALGQRRARARAHASSSATVPDRAAGRSLGRTGACLAVAAVALLPLLPALPYTSTATGVPPLFTAANSPLRTGSVVLSYPLPIGDGGSNDQALLWQSAARMRFKLIAFRGAVAGPTSKPIRGAALLIPPFEAEQVLLWGLYGAPNPPPPNNAATARAIQIFLHTYNVDAVTLVPSSTRTKTVIAYFTAALHAPPVEFEGSYVWPAVQQDLQRLGLGSG